MVLDSDNEYRNRDAYGYQTNKDIPIKKVSGIHIDNFRSLKNKEIIMGKKVTFLVGRNATMKTSLMGLIAHPYDSDSKDGFGRSLKKETLGAILSPKEPLIAELKPNEKLTKAEPKLAEAVVEFGFEKERIGKIKGMLEGAMNAELVEIMKHVEPI